MNIFDILKEAKNPTPPKTNTSTEIDSTVDEKEVTDYTKEVDDTTEQDQPPETNDENNQDDATDYTDEVETDDTPEDETSDEDTSDDQEDEPTDYTDNVDSDNEASEDEPSDGEETDNPDTGGTTNPEEKLENQQNLELLNRLVDLYYNIQASITKIDTVSTMHILTNKVIIQIKQNFNVMMDKIYTHITTSFTSNTYVKNLYIYNYIIEAYKVNVEMLKKLNVFK